MSRSCTGTWSVGWWYRKQNSAGRVLCHQHWMAITNAVRHSFGMKHIRMMIYTNIQLCLFIMLYNIIFRCSVIHRPLNFCSQTTKTVCVTTSPISGAVARQLMLLRVLHNYDRYILHNIINIHKCFRCIWIRSPQCPSSHWQFSVCPRKITVKLSKIAHSTTRSSWWCTNSTSHWPGRPDRSNCIPEWTTTTIFRPSCIRCRSSQIHQLLPWCTRWHW